MGTFFSKPDQVWPSPGGFWVVNCFWNERFAFFIIPGGSDGRGWFASANLCQSRFFATFLERSRSRPLQTTGPFRKD